MSKECQWNLSRLQYLLLQYSLHQKMLDPSLDPMTGHGFQVTFFKESQKSNSLSMSCYCKNIILLLREFVNQYGQSTRCCKAHALHSCRKQRWHQTFPLEWSHQGKYSKAEEIWTRIFCLLSKDCKLCSIFSCTNSLMFWLVSSASKAKYDVKVYWEDHKAVCIS